MKIGIPIEQLLRWRLAQAEAEAPPAPRATRLLERARPWWETWPERFQAVVERLARIQIAYGHAMAEPQPNRTGYPVPVLVAAGSEELEGSARVLYLSVRDGRLRLRFQLDVSSQQPEASYEVTFVSEPEAQPWFSARACQSVENEYRLDAELPADASARLVRLKVTDRMPFRLILRAAN